MTFLTRFSLLSACSSLLLLTGCATSFSPSPVQSPVGQIQGRVHGGQPPIGGSHVYILQTGTGGYAGPGIAASTANASTSLLTGTGNSDSIGGYALTDSNGFFSVTGSYSCTAGTQVYAYVTGGNAGGGANANIGMMAILGACPSGGGDLSSTVPYLWINEVTTVAAAYAMAGFATDPTHVSIGPSGTSTTTSALAATGIANAFANSNNLVNIGTGTALLTTPGGNGTVPQAKIDTLANILASCVNSTDSAFANCTTLFGAAAGGTNATTPTDTAIAAINIAHTPGAGVATLYGLQAGVAVPFQPALTAKPNDLTLSVYYTGTGIYAPSYVAAHQMAVDASGNIWVASDSSTVNALSAFGPQGVPLTGSPFTGNGLSADNSLAIDAASANVWTTNEGTNSLSEFTTAGAAVGNVIPYSAGTTAALATPTDLAFDGTGNIWVNNGGTSSVVVKLTSAAAFMASAANTTYLKSNQGIAATPAGNIWAVGGSKADMVQFTNADVYSTEKATAYYGDAVAVDAGGNVWMANYEKDVSVLNSTTNTVANIATISGNKYLTEYYGIAIDGAGNVWLPDYDNGVIQEVSNAGSVISGTTGYVPSDEPAAGYVPPAAPPTGYIEPFNAVVDGSGNVWFNSLGVAVLQQMIGVAVPVATPLAYGVANSKLGTRP